MTHPFVLFALALTAVAAPLALADHAADPYPVTDAVLVRDCTELVPCVPAPIAFAATDVASGCGTYVAGALVGTGCWLRAVDGSVTFHGEHLGAYADDAVHLAAVDACDDDEANAYARAEQRDLSVAFRPRGDAHAPVLTPYTGTLTVANAC